MGTPVRLPADVPADVPVGSVDGVKMGVARLDPTAPGHPRPQHLPVTAPWSELLPEGGLVRGRTITCVGGAAVSAALAMVAAATAKGSWLAIVGVPWVGVDAAREAGVALERVVRVDVDPLDPAGWADRVAASVDGFDVVLTQVPPRISDRLMRRVQQRLRARGAVLVDVRPVPALVEQPQRARSSRPPSGIDLVVETAVDDWWGLERGSGHLRGRHVQVVVRGRRVPGLRHSRWAVPGSCPGSLPP